MDTEWKEVKGNPSTIDKKICEGKGCSQLYQPKWHTTRRCDRCRKEKRPYKAADEPF